jgi:hypothetical protein
MRGNLTVPSHRCVGKADPVLRAGQAQLLTLPLKGPIYGDAPRR